MSRKPYTIPTAIVSLASAAVVLAGCGGQTGGDPQPTGGSDSSTVASGGSGLPKNGAPAVAHPIDPSKYVSNVCLTLNQSAQSALHITEPGQAQQGGPGPQCVWHIVGTSSAAPGEMTNVEIEIANNALFQGGLSNFYGNRSKMKVFEPLGEIDGYPAVLAMPKDTRPQGTCSVTVGVTDNLVFAAGASVKLGSSTDPCTNAKKVAELMVQTIKGGS